MEQVADLTDRQIWERYLIPRIKQQNREHRRARQEQTVAEPPWETPPTFAMPEVGPVADAAVDRTGAELDPFATLRVLVDAGMMSPAEYQRAAAAQQAMGAS